MEFSNAGIDVQSLPKAENIELRPVDPRYWKVLVRQWLTAWTIILLIAIAVIGFNSSLHNIYWILPVATFIVFFAGLHWFLMGRSFKHKAYAVREHDIIYRTGWLIQSVRVCPFHRIQHCSVDAGLYERRFGLASLSVYTAGGNEADMRIPGLPAETANTLRELVISKTGGHEENP